MVKQAVPNVSKCPTCTNPGEIIPQFGLVACKDCRNKEKGLSERTYEFVPDRIKEDRLATKDHTVQPFRNGQLSKEYIDLYGTKHIKATDAEIKNAKNVWGRDLPGNYYKE